MVEACKAGSVAMSYGGGSLSCDPALLKLALMTEIKEFEDIYHHQLLGQVLDPVFVGVSD